MAQEMKDSGIPWIGEIPADWELKNIKALFSFGKGLPITKDNLCDSGVPVISYGQIHSKRNSGTHIVKDLIRYVSEEYINSNPDSFAHQGDFIFADTSEDLDGCGNCAYVDVDIPIFAGYHTIILRAKVQKSNQYFAYLFKSDMWRRQIRERVIGVKLFSISQKVLKKTSLIIPPQEIQCRIADYLNCKCAEIDAVLEKTRTSIEEYKKLRRAIITQAVTKGIRGDKPMKESGIEWAPLIPEDWSNYRGKHLFYETNERSETGSEELLTVSHKTGITPRSQKNVNMFMSESLVGYKICREGDIAANTMWMWQGAIGVSAYYGVISPSYNTYRQRNGAFDPQYLDYLLRIPPLVGQYNVCSTGITASRLRLYPEQFLSLRFIVPPMEEQQEIVMFLRSRVNDIDVLIQKKEQFLAELETYKKSLIYEYVTGKKEVQQKQQVKEVVVYPFFPAVFQATNPRFAQAILMSKVLDSCKVKMGRVKLEKMMFVLENSIGFDFDTEYMREAAGPLDKSVYECEQIIGRRNKWFTIRKSQYGVSYKPTSEYSKYKKYYAQYFSDYEDAINKVISIFNDFDADQAEVIATLYGAWNDCIIDKRSYTDNDIVDEVLNHWHPKKRRFPKDMWLRAIQRMRELDLVPHGYGRHTIIKQN